jgi:hypothetical protein
LIANGDPFSKRANPSIHDINTAKREHKTHLGNIYDQLTAIEQLGSVPHKELALETGRKTHFGDISDQLTAINKTR